jgi:hypothetical protein
MLYDDDQVEALVRGMVKGVKQQMSDQSMSVSEWLETNRAPKADPETMTTPTTGTAPLIERLVAALRARYGHTKTGRPDLVASAWRDDAYAILEALAPAEVAASDGLWVEFADPDCSCCKGTGWRLQRGWEPGTATTKYPCECHRYHKERQIDAALQASAPATTARDERERSGAR